MDGKNSYTYTNAKQKRNDGFEINVLFHIKKIFLLFKFGKREQPTVCLYSHKHAIETTFLHAISEINFWYVIISLILILTFSPVIVCWLYNEKITLSIYRSITMFKNYMRQAPNLFWYLSKCVQGERYTFFLIFTFLIFLMSSFFFA